MVGVRIQSAPSAIINQAALAAARQSTYPLASSTTVPFDLAPVAGGVKDPDVRIPGVQVHASATVTYEIKP